MADPTIALDDLLDLRIPSDLRIAPDGDALLFVERRVDGASGQSLSRLVMIRRGQAPRPFTAGDVLDTAPRFSPDGRRVAFLRRPPSRSEPVETSLAVIPTDGGEARVLVRERGSFGPPEWSPDGRWLAVSFRRADELPEGESSPLAIPVRRLHYKLDGAGYLPRDRFHLYRVDTRSEAPELVPLTDPEGDWDDTSPAWSPDGEAVAFVSNRREQRDRDVENGDIFVIGSRGGRAVQCTRRRGTAATPCWTPDSRWILAPLCPGPPGAPMFRLNVALFRVDPRGQVEETSLTADLDRCVLNLTIDDLWGLDHMGPRPVVSRDGRRVVFPVSDRGTTALCALDLDRQALPSGAIERLVDDRIVVTFDGAPAADRLALLTTSPREPGRLEVCDWWGAERTVWSWPLADYCGSRAIAEPTPVSATGAGGDRVEGWLLLPAGEGPFPLLLNIHGGPCVQFGPGFFHELQTYVARGLAVLLVNPHGSQGYGADFAAAIHRDWGELPTVDLMAVLDRVLAEHPIDGQRLGIVGGSYGGYLSTWIIAHSDRFKAACVQRTVSQMEAMVWSDFGASFADILGVHPWEEPEVLARLSPASYLTDIRTPVLILQGLGDMRTPADQGERLYVLLRLMGKDAELVLFPEGTHDLSRNGRPRQRVERLRIIHDFFARHLAL